MITIGIDEVGRGCLAGPVVAGAVALDIPIRGLKDSKLLSAKKRQELDKVIRLKSAAYGTGWASAKEIDELGLTLAVGLAMSRAIEQISMPYDKIIIDGNYNYLKQLSNVTTLVKADNLIPSVSAASIIAKVARDNYMAQMAKRIPGYGFEKHVGYGTKSHIASLVKHGPSEIHRYSFKPVNQFN